MNIFNEIMEKTGRKTEKTISVSCKQVTKMLEKRYSFEREDRRQPKIPKEMWIRQALDGFVKIDYAYKDSKDNDKYYIKYSYPRKDSMLDVFARKLCEASSKSKKRREGEQLEFSNLGT